MKQCKRPTDSILRLVQRAMPQVEESGGRSQEEAEMPLDPGSKWFPIPESHSPHQTGLQYGVRLHFDQALAPAIAAYDA